MEIYIRNGVKKIEQLKHKIGSDGVKRLDFFEMNGVVDTKLGFNSRRTETFLYKDNFEIKNNENCDYWMYQINSLFRREIRNSTNNTIYVGTKDGIDTKKLKVKPKEWELMILKEWNEMFYKFADKHGKIKVWVSW